METVDRPLSLTERAVHVLRAAILDGTLVPDRLYTATELGRELQVSRTPIREALLELERRGLVEIVPNRGVRVRNISVDALIEIFQVRIMLEVPLARRATALRDQMTIEAVEVAYEAFAQAAAAGDPTAVLRADRDFHHALLSGAGNAKAMHLLLEQRDFVLSTGVGTVPTSRTPQECFEDHLDVMTAFRDGDADAAGAAVARHIAHTANMLITQESASRPDFVDADLHGAIDWLIHP